MAGHRKKLNKKKGKKLLPNNKKVKDQSGQEVEKIDQGVKEEVLDEHSGAMVRETMGQAEIEGATQRKFTYLSKKFSVPYLKWLPLLGIKKLIMFLKGEDKEGNTPKSTNGENKEGNTPEDKTDAEEVDAEEVDADDERHKLLFAKADERTARNNSVGQDLALLNAGTKVLTTKHDEMKARDLEEASACQDVKRWEWVDCPDEGIQRRLCLMDVSLLVG